MRRIVHIGFTALVLVTVSCQKEFEPVAGTTPAEGRIYTAVIEEEQTPEGRSSVTIDGNVARFSWADGDLITVISSDGAAVENTEIRVSEGNATFTLSSVDSPKYATYPQIAKEYKDGVLSSVALPPIYNDYKGSTNVPMFADMSGGNDVANFRHIGAAVRITLKNIPEGCTKFKFTADGKRITGNFDLDVTEEIPAIRTSDSDWGNTVTFNFAEGTKDMDFFIPVPVGTYNGFTVKLYDGNVIRYRKSATKTFTVERKELRGFKAIELPLVLKFDFSVQPAGWPTANRKPHVTGGTKCQYLLDGVSYEFLLADPLNAGRDYVYWTKASDGLGYIKFEYQQRSLGLPAIEGRKLVKVECYNAAGESGTNYREAGITTQLYNGFDDRTAALEGIECVPGGDVQKLSVQYGTYSWNLTGTENNRVYYLFNLESWIGIRGLTLTYEGKEALISEVETVPEDDGTIQVRAGSFNIRVSTEDSGTDHEWSKRKAGVISSIRDNDFDFFGVQEVCSDQQTYLTEQLADTYACKFFSPYASDGNGDKAQGLIYRKDKFELSEWNYFWPSDNPDEMPPTGFFGGNDVESFNQRFNRGSCCGILTHKASGARMFVMVMHGFVNDDTGDKYAYVNNDREKMYNPDGYPAFFIGDMNANPDRAAYTTWTGYWKDTFAEVSADRRTGPEKTYNNWQNNPISRLDYIFFKGAYVTPKNYVCDNDKYDGFYPSDHFPIYADFIIDTTKQ